MCPVAVLAPVQSSNHPFLLWTPVLCFPNCPALFAVSFHPISFYSQMSIWTKSCLTAVHLTAGVHFINGWLKSSILHQAKCYEKKLPLAHFPMKQVWNLKTQKMELIKLNWNKCPDIYFTIFALLNKCEACVCVVYIILLYIPILFLCEHQFLCGKRRMYSMHDLNVFCSRGLQDPMLQEENK